MIGASWSLSGAMMIFGGSALVLILLHRLTLRVRSVEVPSLWLFSGTARRRRRVAWFGAWRHLKTLAFLLVLLALLAFALVDLDEGATQRTWVLLDEGAAMAVDGRTAAARALALELVERLPRSHEIAIVALGDVPRALATAVGRDRSAARDALRTWRPFGSTLSLSQRVASLSESVMNAAPFVVTTVETSLDLPTLRVLRVGEPVKDGGIVAVDTEGGSLRVRLMGALNGRTLNVVRGGSSIFSHAPLASEWVDTGVALDGTSVTVELAPRDPFVANDRVVLPLPDRRAVRVALPSEAPALLAWCAVDPALEATEPTDADVVIEFVAGEADGLVDALQTIDGTRSPIAPRNLRSVARDDRLQPLLFSGDRVLVALDRGPKRRVVTTASMVTPSLAEEGAWPALMTRMLRRAAGREEGALVVAAAEGHVSDEVIVLPRLLEDRGYPSTATLPPERPWLSGVAALLGLAVLLLLVDAWLVFSGRIP